MRVDGVFYGLLGDGEVVVIWSDPGQPKHQRCAPTGVRLEVDHAAFVEAVRAAEQRLLGHYTEYI